MAIFFLQFPIYQIIYDHFYYMGYFRYNGINSGRMLFAMGTAYLFVILNRSVRNEFLNITYTISLTLFFFGELCLYVCDYKVDMTMIIILSCFLLFIKVIDHVRLDIGYVRTSRDMIKILLIITVIIFIPYLQYYRYINLQNLLFIDVYETRSIFNNLKMPAVLSYLYGPLARVIIPILIVEYYKRGKKVIVAMLSLMLAYLFLCGALKSIFIGLLAIFFFYSGDYRQKKNRYICMILLLEIAGLLSANFIGNFFIINILRRVYFIAARFNNYYVEYFRGNWTYYLHSGFAFFSDNNWMNGLDISHYAGKYIMGTGTNANTGIFVEGYYSFGLAGAVIYLIVPILILLFLKELNYRPEFYGIVFLYLYYFNTSILSTMLLTHGLFIFLIVAFVYLRRKTSGNTG